MHAKCKRYKDGTWVAPNSEAFKMMEELETGKLSKSERNLLQKKLDKHMKAMDAEYQKYMKEDCPTGKGSVC